eukprot:1328401-Pyramimonas_sp.AAC.1
MVAANMTARMQPRANSRPYLSGRQLLLSVLSPSGEVYSGLVTRIGVASSSWRRLSSQPGLFEIYPALSGRVIRHGVLNQRRSLKTPGSTLVTVRESSTVYVLITRTPGYQCSTGQYSTESPKCAANSHFSLEIGWRLSLLTSSPEL